MPGGEEIIGDLAQAALTARAIEPSHGESGDDGHTHERACLNCGTGLVGRHCHGCGQAAHVHRTIAAFFHDLLHGVSHFEGKIWRTLPMLAWKPGQLTREYIDGRRASYVSPIALFLFVVFLSFAVFNFSGVNGVQFNTKSIADAAKASEQDALAEVQQLEAQLAEAQQKDDVPPGLEGRLAGARAALDGIRSGGSKLPDTIATGDGGDQALSDRVNAAWRHAKQNPDLLLYKLQSSTYKYAWLIIPLSVPFVWLLFPFNRRFHLYDHTIFVTYSVSFMLVLFALAGLLSLLGASTAGGLLLFYAPVHMYRQVRGTYDLTRFGAWWRTWFLALFALIVLVLFVTVLAVMVAAA